MMIVPATLAALLALGLGMAPVETRPASQTEASRATPPVEPRLAAPPVETRLDWTVGPGSTLGYALVHKFHEVNGVSRAVEGRVRFLPDGGVQAMVRSRVDAFDSGNGNRDAHMLEATEAVRFPLVVLKVAGALAPPATTPARADVTLRGAVTFHGVTRPVEVPVTATFETSRRVTAIGRFTISLDGFGVERPSLLFVKVDDAVVITATLVLEAEGP